MNILFITPYLPYPLTEGGRISQFAVIDYLRKNNQVILAVPIYSDYDKSNVEKLKSIWPEVSFELIYCLKSHSDQRLRQIFKTTANLLFGVTKSIKTGIQKVVADLFRNNLEARCPFPKYFSGEVSDNFSPRLLRFAEIKNKSFAIQLLNIISKYKIDIIQVDLIEFIDLVLLLPKNIKKVFVHHEIRFACLGTALATIVDKFGAYENYLLDFIRIREISILKLYNGIFVFSEEDRGKLKKELPESSIFVAPFPVLNNQFINISKSHLSIKKLVFVGGESHEPNKDAIEWYAKEISNKSIDDNKLKLHVIGKWTRKTTIKLRKNKSIYFTGVIEDLANYCENSIMIVPIRIGSGIRTKILYAMAQGVPVISTDLGCEGIDVIKGEDILIANSPQEFNSLINLLLSDTAFTYKMVVNAQRKIKSKYSQDVNGKIRQNYYDQIIKED